MHKLMIILGIYFYFFMFLPAENNFDYFLLKEPEINYNDIVTKSLRALYNKNAIDIENDTIFLKLGDENFKREFKYNEHVVIDGKKIMILEYNEDKLYVKLYYRSKESNNNDNMVIDFRTRIKTGRVFFGALNFKFSDCIWYVNDIYMGSGIE